jgi:hypothetical protein
MTLLLIDGFDTYATGNYTGKWVSQQGTIGAWGRQGTNGLKHTTVFDMAASVSNKKTLIVGFALKLSRTKSWTLVEFKEAATVQLGVYTDASNQIIIKRGTTILKSTGYSLPTNTWVYLEFKGTIDNSAGSWELRINSITEDSQSGIDTQQTGYAYINSIMFRFSGIGASTQYIEDIYIFDDETAFCNDFVGDVHVETSFPDGNGYLIEWVGEPPGGDNYTKLNETDPNDDTDFVATSGVGYIDSYDFETLITSVGSVYGVQLSMWARKDDEGSRVLNAITRPLTTTYSGASPISLGDSYAYRIFHFPTNPETADYWTISEINAAEFGIKEEA